jgi:ubiquinone/menaquinone biosynthesis C-methylase UbiE
MPTKAPIKALALFTMTALAFTALAFAQFDEDDSWEQNQNAYQPPELIMDAIGVKPGMVIAEVGAGRGRIVVHMAARVGFDGKVYANDIDQEKLDYLKFRCERDSIYNVWTILGEVDDPLLPEGQLDLVYFINTYHHLADPVELMRNILPSLKPDGLLVIIEHDPEKHPDEGGNHSTPHDELLQEAEEAGYELLRLEDILERDYINIFRPIPKSGDQTMESE